MSESSQVSEAATDSTDREESHSKGKKQKSHSDKGGNRPISRVMNQAKAQISKMVRRESGAETIPDSEESFEKQKAKEVDMQKRKEEYERLGLGDKTKYGLTGGGGYNIG